jgi:hypothetical protein
MARSKQSIITKGKTEKAFIKEGVQYFKCVDTGTLFCNKLEQSNMVGGTDEEKRNAEHNPTRLQRFKDMGATFVLDYGCGSGILVDYLNENGVQAYGYDPYSEKYNELKNNFYNLISLVEVIEHMTAPFEELDIIFKQLSEGGTVYIETSFSDWLTESDEYINPLIGHQTIFSHAGLDRLMTDKGFKIGNHINRNVRIYHK